MKVLIVEDDAELRSVLGRGLEEEGFTVEAVATGAELLARVADGLPDVFVIDIGLPDAGGDDYVSKPFALAELVVRLHALIRRSGGSDAVEAAGLRLDPATHAVGDVPLTPTEFRLLARLLAQPGEAVRRRELVRAGWPHGAMVRENTLDAYVARLRRKLKGIDDAPDIVTVHGVGYRVG
jgi:two-component system, OmpR family, response regulator